MKRSRIIDGIAITERNRFSCYVKADDTKGLAILDSWIAHFRTGGIPCVIAETDRGFAVYRLGLQDDEADD